MKKKSPAGRVTEKEKTEKIIKNIKADLTSTSKSGRVKKKAKKSPSRGKTPQKKVPSKISAKTKKGIVKKKESPGNTKKKIIKKVSPKKEKPSVKKIGRKKKEEAVSKKVKTISAGKIKAKLTDKGKVAKKEKPDKPSVKAKTAKRTPLPQAKKKVVPKSAGKPGKEHKTSSGAKAETKKKVEKRKKQIATKKEKIALPKEIKKEKVLGIFIPEGIEKKIRQKKTGGIGRVEGLKGQGIPREKESKEARGKVKADSIRENYLQPMPLEPLPSEYGEDSIALITVNPYRIFAFWEVREDTLKLFQGIITIRLYDITDINFDYMDANSYLDREVSERIGDMYLDVSPAKDYTADIGMLSSEGNFITIARSHKVSTPGITVAEGFESLVKTSGTGMRVGY